MTATDPGTVSDPPGAPTVPDRLGEPVPVPDYVDAHVWERLAARVVMIPGGCHLWTGPPRDDGYAQISAHPHAIRPADGPVALADPPAGGREPDRIWRAHRLAYCALTGVMLTATDHLLHQCDEPLCVPITVPQLTTHIARGDNITNVAEREARGRGVRRGRYGMTIPTRADKRGQAARSRALHQALTAALNAGATREDLAAVIAGVAAAGDPKAHQPTLF